MIVSHFSYFIILLLGGGDVIETLGGHKTLVLKVVLCTCFTDPSFIAFLHVCSICCICYFVKVSLFVERYLNAHVSSSGNWTSIHKGQASRNGRLLEDMLFERQLEITDTRFQKQRGKLWIYLSDMSQSKSQIDFIICRIWPLRGLKMTQIDLKWPQIGPKWPIEALRASLPLPPSLSLSLPPSSSPSPSPSPSPSASPSYSSWGEGEGEGERGRERERKRGREGGIEGGRERRRERG